MGHEPLYPFKEWLPAPIYWLYRAWRTLVSYCVFAGFWSTGVVMAWLWLPILSLWPGSRVVKMRRALRSMRRGFHVFHFCMRVLRLFDRTCPLPTPRLHGIPSDQPCVLVANHPTLCDVTSILSLFPNVVAVARPVFARNPLISRVIRLTGFVPTGTHVLQECENRLKMGFDVLVFPEGTRSPREGDIHPFHRGAFELAARAKVPIVLLKLSCNPPTLSKRLPVWKVCDRKAMLTIEPFDTIKPSDDKLDTRALCRTIEQRYREVLGYSDPAVPTSEQQALGNTQ